MSLNTGIQRMNQLLEFWEKTCFYWQLDHIRKSRYIPDDSYPDYNKFRDCILGMSQEEIMSRKFYKFLPEAPSQFHEELYTISFIPITIMKWNMASRRVFSLSPEIQNLLDATSVNNLEWQELKFPFDSFVVTLGEPLFSVEGTAYDTLVMSRVEELLPEDRYKEIWELRLLPENLANRKVMSKKERVRISRKLLSGNMHDRTQGLDYFSHKFSDSMDDTEVPTLYIIPEIGGGSISETIKKLRESQNELFGFAVDSALHIITNFCVYLENFPSSIQKRNVSRSSSSKKKRRLKKRPLHNVFVNETSKLFEVSCKFKMSKKDINQMVDFIRRSKKSSERRAHWRRAHWRRKPGYGNVPFEKAPKDWIPMKLINAHKLPENSLPIAAEAKI